MAYIVSNKTQAIQTFTETADLISRGGVSVHSGKKLGESAFKGLSDWGRGDVPCAF